jgi:hypothetical protein
MLVTIVRAIGVPETQVGSVIDASDWLHTDLLLRDGAIRAANADESAAYQKAQAEAEEKAQRKPRKRLRRRLSARQRKRRKLPRKASPRHELDLRSRDGE